MRVLVTGAQGKVGSFAAKAFDAAGHKVVGVDIASPAYGPQPAGTLPYAAYGYGFHGGFGFLGLLFPLFFLFLIFGIARAAFRGGRGGWGHGYGHGYGKWGPGGPGGSDRDAWVADWHRRLHEDGGTTSPTGSGSQGSGPSGSGPAGQAG